MTNVIDELEKTEPAADAPAPQSSPKVKVVLLLVLVVGVIAGVVAYFHYRDRISTDDAQVDGNITAIAPKIAGNVSEVLVNDNQEVKKGQVLLRIDARDYQAKFDLARAALWQAQSQAQAAKVTVPLVDATTQSGTSAADAQLGDSEAELQRARLGAEIAAGSDLAWARANVETKQAANDRAQADLERMKPLVAKAEISRLQFDAYTAAAKVAESELQAAKEKLSTAGQDAQIKRAQLAAAQAKVAAARAGVDQSKANRRQVAVRMADANTAIAAVQAAAANLAAAELMLSYTTIVSPVDGVVTHKGVQVGHIIQPGQSLMAIVPLNDVWVTANYKETQLAEVKVGQRVEIGVDMYGTSVGGTVDSISGATGSRLSLLPPENATGNFVKTVQRIPVKIRVNTEHKNVILRPGMNVDATIFTK